MSQTPITQKSPWIAGLLSAIFPGIGQLYNEEYGKGMLFMLLFCGTFVLWILGTAIGASSMHAAPHAVFRAQMLFFPFEPRIMILLWFILIGPAIYLMSLFDAVNTANRRNVRFTNAYAAAGATPPQPPYSPPQQPSAAARAYHQFASGAEHAQAQKPTMMNAGPQSQEFPPHSGNGKPSVISGRMVAGVILLFIGSVVVLAQIHIDVVEFMVESIFYLVNFWPLIPFGLGVRLLIDYQKQQDKGQLVLGAVLTAIGAAFMLQNWFGFEVFNAISRLCPYALLFGGALLIVTELTNRKKS